MNWVTLRGNWFLRGNSKGTGSEITTAFSPVNAVEAYRTRRVGTALGAARGVRWWTARTIVLGEQGGLQLRRILNRYSELRGCDCGKPRRPRGFREQLWEH